MKVEDESDYTDLSPEHLIAVCRLWAGKTGYATASSIAEEHSVRETPDGIHLPDELRPLERALQEAQIDICALVSAVKYLSATVVMLHERLEQLDPDAGEQEEPFGEDYDDES